MEVKDSDIYSQLNERSRFYTKHIWQVPFAYIVVVAWAVEKLPEISNPFLCGFVTIGLGVFTISILVFVIHMKYYERRAVYALQEFDQSAGGGSRWFMSFAWYIRTLLILLAYSFFLAGIHILAPFQWIWLILVATGLSIFIGCILVYDWKRTRELKTKIRKSTNQTDPRLTTP
jgi:hypothetical protein